MKIAYKKLCELVPTPGNPRNSEGDFIRLASGEILFAFSRFSGDSWNDHAASDICALYSPDGEHFDPADVRTLVTPDRFGGDNAMSVTLLPSQNGGISLYFGVKYDTKDLTAKPVRDEFFRIDSPDGYDFSGTPKLLFPQDHRGYFVVNNDRVTVTSTGRIIIPASRHGQVFRDGRFQFLEAGTARFYRSDDGGETFRCGISYAFPDPENQHGLQEPGVVELPDGRLYAYFRTDAGCQYESYSHDNGSTWTAPAPSAFESPLSPMKIAKNPYNGKYYAVRNPIRNYPDSPEHPRYPNTWGRTPLAISESDDGVHFGEPVLLESDLHYGYCYPAIYFLSEKEALIAYCSGGVDLVPLQKTTIGRITFA